MNKGEWSEFYAFLKILGDGEVYGAGSNLEKVEKWHYPLRSVIRANNSNRILHYIVQKDAGIIKIVSADHTTLLNEISQSEFKGCAERLLKHIKSSAGSFEVVEMDSFINALHNPKIKEGSQEKRDITVILHDPHVGRDQELGFSIKSKLGGDSTLFNAITSTNFLYEVKNINLEKLEDYKKLKTKSLVKKLDEDGCDLEFKGVEGKQFQKNLKLIDTSLDEILGLIVKNYYSQSRKKISELADILETEDPLDFGAPEQKLYHYKTKQFLSACALGMTAGKIWTGDHTATGGYLIVKEDGSLVCYHIFNWNAFQDYLFTNTYLDTASTTRHKFGRIYFEDDKTLLKLNLQVRFNF